MLESSVRQSDSVEIPTIRLRRLRQHANLRKLVKETELTVNDLVHPIFIRHGNDQYRPISTMPGHAQLSVDQLAKEIQAIQQLQIPAVMLFGIPEHKDEWGSSAYQAEGLIQNSIKLIKDLAPELLIMADLCFCEYTHHGHCGFIYERNNKFDVHNDKTLELLTKQAISLADAGVDVLSPSGMIDGMVKAIRTGLDQANHQEVAILSHTTKYASSLYGPFREATEGAPQFGDRKTYQMDPANSNEALREASLDIDEGTDILMVKPANYYLDIIYRIKQHYPSMPLAAYQVSGEFAMIKAAAANGWLDEKKVALESLLAIKRAGANFIVNYFAKDVAKWLQE